MASKRKHCDHYIRTRRQGSYWWVCYHCGKSLTPEQNEALFPKERAPDGQQEEEEEEAHPA